MDRLPQSAGACAQPCARPSSPSYLYLNGNLYYFRIVVPRELRKLWGRKEIRLSLRTPHRRKASARAMLLFAELSSAISGGNMLGLTEIRRRMNSLLQSLLEQEHYDFSQRRSVTFPDGSSLSPGELAGAQARIVNAWTNDKESLRKTADECLPELYAMGIFKPEEVTPEDTLAIAKAYLQTQVTMHKIIEAREHGDYAFEENFIAKDSNTVSPELFTRLRELSMPKKIDDKGTMLYSEAIERYVHQHIEDQVWKPRIVGEHRRRIETFLDVMGDMPINSIRSETLREFRNILRKLPPRRSRDKRYRGKTVQEILAMSPKQTLSNAKVNIDVAATCALLKWCEGEEYIRFSMPKNLLIPERRNVKNLRLPFTREDLALIFAHPKFSQGKFVNAAYFGAPLIALFSGMRREEICQLACSSIYEYKSSGIWVFNIETIIEDGEETAGVKTEAGNRIIPIHKTLIDLGLLEYRHDVMRHKHRRLFPDLNRTGRGIYGAQPGKQFGTIVAEVVPEPKGKTFYSLRHNFADFYAGHDLQNAKFRQLFGHRPETLAEKQYGKPAEPDVLYHELIEKLNYGLDLSHLMDSRFRAYAPEKRKGDGKQSGKKSRGGAA